jgi:hypothetical protein
MQLKELAQKPKLELVTVDTPVIVEAYGEPLEFYMMDRQDLPTYLKLAQIKDNQEEIFEIVKDIVLDDKGKRVLGDGELLPVDIMVPVLEAAIQRLGNMKPQTSEA